MLHVWCWRKVSCQHPGISLKPGPSLHPEFSWLCFGADQVTLELFGHWVFVAKEVACELKIGEQGDASASSMSASHMLPEDCWTPPALTCSQPPPSIAHRIKEGLSIKQSSVLWGGKNWVTFPILASIADTSWGQGQQPLGNPLFYFLFFLLLLQDYSISLWSYNFVDFISYHERG